MAQSFLIFVVEDDPIIQDFVNISLDEGGLRLPRHQAEKTPSLGFKKIAQFSSLIIDVNLVPGKLTGWGVARRARQLKPEMPVIYMTAASSHEWTAHGVPNSLLLTKPFASAQLITAVSQLLNEAMELKVLTAMEERG